MSIRTRSIYRSDNGRGIPAKRDNDMTHTGSSTTAVTKGIAISDLDSDNISVDLVYEDCAITTGITAVLQSSHDGGSNWDHTHGTVTITAAASTRTVKTIELNMAKSGDQSELPIRPIMRVVVIGTNAADTVALDEIHITNRTRN